MLLTGQRSHFKVIQMQITAIVLQSQGESISLVLPFVLSGQRVVYISSLLVFLIFFFGVFLQPFMRLITRYVHAVLLFYSRTEISAFTSCSSLFTIYSARCRNSMSSPSETYLTLKPEITIVIREILMRTVTQTCLTSISTS